LFKILGLKHLSKIHKFDQLLPGSLEFFGPYGSKGWQVVLHHVFIIFS